MKLNVAFWALLIIYMILGVTSKLLFPELLSPPRILPLLYAIAFITSMVVGYASLRRIPVKGRVVMYALVILVVLSSLGWWGTLIGIFFVVIPHMVEMSKDAKSGSFFFVVLGAGFVAFCIPLILREVPLWNIEARYTSIRFFYLASGYLLAWAISMRPNFKIFLFGILVAIVSTFRTVGLTVTISYTLKLIQEGRIKPKEVRELLKLSSIPLTILAVFFVRHYATLHTYPEWKLGFFETLLYRMGFTYSVYERLFEIGMPLGNLEILTSTDPKGYVGRLFGSDVVYNYTIFGQPVHDFGIFGLTEGFLLGGILRDAERTQTTEVLALTLFILTIPIGIDAFFLPATAFLAYMALGVKKWKRTEH